MELTLAHLNLANATSEVPDYGAGLDPYQAIQVHDYQSVSFFRQPAEIKASSSKIIDLFQKYYPGMSWELKASRIVVAKLTSPFQRLSPTSILQTCHCSCNG